jgi:branched-chain amino acid transport system substrate-binding protein
MQKMGYKEFSILYSNSANGVSYKNAFEKIAKNLGCKIVETIGYNENKSDYRIEIGRLKRIKSKAIYIAGLDTELGLILKQSKELGLNAQFFASAGAISDKLLEIAGVSSEGLICGSAGFDTSISDEKIKKFVEEYKFKFSETPDFIAANSYDAVFIISELFKKDLITGEQIKSGLYKIKNFRGVGGVITFDSNGEVNKPIIVLKVSNGRFIHLN